MEGNAAGSIIAGIGSLTGGISGAVSSAAAIKQEDRNYLQRKRLIRYQKDIQKQSWDREDNAVGRRVADLKRSGLNPNLAAGSAAGASGPVALKAPIRDTGPTERAGQIPGQIIDRFANIAQTLAQKDFLDSQKDFQKIKNQIWGETIPEQISSIKSSAKSAAAAAHVSTKTADTVIATALSNLKTIENSRAQSIQKHQATLKSIQNSNSITDLEIKHARATIDARIEGTQTLTKIKEKELIKIGKLIDPLVGSAEADAIMKELLVQDQETLNSAEKFQRKNLWQNIWKLVDTILGK